MRMQDRVTLITGAGGGIGRGIAERFAREGAVVVANDVDASTAEETAASCRALGAPRATISLASVADSAAVDAMVARVLEDYGRIDVLVTNAGVSAMTDPAPAPGSPDFDVARISDDAWHRMLGVHLDGTFFCIRAVMPEMVRHGGGRILCMSSIAATSGLGSLHYSAAKGGILGFVRAAARPFGKHGVTINAICPGPIDAGMLHHYDRSFIESLVPDIPIGRLGTPADIGACAAFLASDDGGYFTGQYVSPNGGVVIGG
jgi:3-oxoacyl-[acyl-carrier protein] reductase